MDIKNSERVIVLKEYKQSILDELNLLGLNESTLFPELDDYARFIKDKYNYAK